MIYQPPALFELKPPTTNELADAITTIALIPYMYTHSRTVLETEARRKFLIEHYRPQLIAFIESEMRSAPSL